MRYPPALVWVPTLMFVVFNGNVVGVAVFRSVLEDVVLWQINNPYLIVNTSSNYDLVLNTPSTLPCADIRFLIM